MSKTNKALQDRNQRVLMELVSMPGNDICADCKSRAPRWASHNLGIFICVRCASIHRKIGTHVTKVKSLTLDSWTKEQVEAMKEIGNIKANQHWNPDERKNPIPANMEESERDSELEQYIRAKYEYKRFVNKSAVVAAYLGPSQSKLQVPKRSHTAPISHAPASSSGEHRPAVPTIPKAPASVAPRPSSATLPASMHASGASSIGGATPTTSGFSATNPFPTRTVSTGVLSQPVDPRTPSQKSSLTQSTFDDLISLQTPSVSVSLPLQYQNTASPSFDALAQATSPVQSGLMFGQQSFVTPPSAFNSAVGYTPGGNVSTNPFHVSPQFTSMPFIQQTTGSSGVIHTAQTYSAGVNAGLPMTTLAQPQPYAMNPFTQQSGMINPGQYNPMQSPSPQFQTSPSPHIPQTQGGVMTPSGMTMYSSQVQQAQQVFQNMAGNNNPFGGQGWRQ